MRSTKFLLMALAASTFMLSGCFESEAKNDEAAQEQTASATTSGSSITGVYCQKTEERNISLAVIEEMNNDLTFSISVWDNASGNDCGVLNAIADKTEDGTWVYTSGDEAMPCTITVTNENGLTFTQDGECRAQCGASASIGTVTLPADTKTRSEAVQADLDSIYEAPLCE